MHIEKIKSSIQVILYILFYSITCRQGILEKSVYKDNMKNGLSVIINDDDEKNLFSFDNDLENGYYVKFSSDKKISEGYFVDGQRDSLLINWRSNGKKSKFL